MFTEITWATYLRVTAAILFLYYTILLLKLYFPQIKTSVSNGSMTFSQMHAAAETNPASVAGGERSNLTPAGEFNEPGLNDYDIIEEMVDRVKGALKEAVMNQQPEDALIGQLKVIVNDYPLLSKSSFRPSINEFIATESQHHGFASITEEIAEQFWRTL